jgi:hypothetical protein
MHGAMLTELTPLLVRLHLQGKDLLYLSHTVWRNCKLNVITLLPVQSHECSTHLEYCCLAAAVEVQLTHGAASLRHTPAKGGGVRSVHKGGRGVQRSEEGDTGVQGLGRISSLSLQHGEGHSHRHPIRHITHSA